LLAIGADEEDLAGANAIVDPGIGCGYVITSWSAAQNATMADVGTSAIRDRWGRP
jgi:hypothetical protein